MVVDLSTLDWKINNESDPYGFKYGWKGIEMQRPKLPSTFRPYFITINGVRGGKAVSYQSEGVCPGKELYKLHGGERFTKTAIIIAVSVLLVFALVVIGLVWKFGKHKPQEID